MSSTPQVLREEAGLVFISKPPGVPCTRERGGGGTPIVDLVTAALGAPEPLRLCHRLDRSTSGVMVLARDVAAQRAASAEFEHHRVRKSYLALCHGVLTGLRVVDAPLGPDPHPPRQDRGRQAVRPDGKPARTVLLGLWTDGTVSLVAARPGSGRTHQVRVHLASQGLPLVGDLSYGGPPGPRPFLHAAWLALHVAGRDVEGGAAVWPDLQAELRARGTGVPDPDQVDDALTQVLRASR